MTNLRLTSVIFLYLLKYVKIIIIIIIFVCVFIALLSYLSSYYGFLTYIAFKLGI